VSARYITSKVMMSNNYGIRENAKYAYLIVHSKNKNAISLYLHMGFAMLYDYSFYCKPYPMYKIIDA
jgi:hypothetical protein